MEVFEGEKGFMDAIAGCFEIDWLREDLEKATATILKKYNAEVHSQTAIECALQLKAEEKFDSIEIQHVDMETFDVAYHIIGGGDEGDKMAVSTKEEADHSLPYLISVAFLDGQVMPEQYTAERITRGDVQRLLQKVSIRPSDEFSNRFPKEMPCRLTMTLRNGRVVSKEIHDYPGFISQPMSWEMAFEKFERITAPFTTAPLRRSIGETVKNLDSVQVRDLTKLFHNIERPHSKLPVKAPHAGKHV